MSEKPFGLAVKAFVCDAEGRCLLIRRSKISKNFRFKWDLPGGKVDAGEQFDDALMREVAEETGLTVTLERVAGATEYEMTAVRVVVLFMDAHAVAGEVRLSEEHDKWQWVPRSELAAMDLSDQLLAFVQQHAGPAAGD